MSRCRGRDIPLMLDDGFRGGITVGAATVGILILTLVTTGTPDPHRARLVLIGICCAYTGAFLAYLVWTHLVYARISPAAAKRIARRQHHRRPPGWARLFTFGSSEGWATSAALLAFVGSIAASIYGASGGVVAVTAVALIMAATAWATVVYTYALRYFRLHSAGEAFRFEFDDEPRFGDFLSFALMVSSAGSHSPAVPTTRPGMRAMRSHTVIAFVFNALIIAMTVSLITNLLASYAGA